jgi:hypothetical protein
MKKAAVVSILAIVLLLAVAVIGYAQQPKKVHRIGFLAPGSLSAYSTQIEAFRHGLRDPGYIEEKNIAVEYRYPERNFDQFAGELVRLKLDVIVVGGMCRDPSCKASDQYDPYCDGCSW